MHGRSENLAIRSIVYELGYEGLPEFADDRVSAYLTRHGRPIVSTVDRPFQALAPRQINAARGIPSIHSVARWIRICLSASEG